MSHLRALSGAVVLASALVAFAASAEGETIRVTIRNLEFTPATITARVGDTIEWVNTDFVAHTATAKDGGFDVHMEAGATGRTALSKAGAIQYNCTFHPNMVGMVTVLP